MATTRAPEGQGRPDASHDEASNKQMPHDKQMPDEAATAAEASRPANVSDESDHSRGGNTLS